MGKFHFNALDTHGIIRDRPARELPAEVDKFAWSDGGNVRFKDGKAQNMPGTEIWITVTSQPSFIHAINDALVEASAGKNDQRIFTIGSDAGNANARIWARQALTTNIIISGVHTTANPLYAWALSFQNMLVFGNRSVTPKAVAATGTAAILAYNTATTWHAGTAGMLSACRFIRPYGQFLVAFAPLENGTEFPDRVHWSTDADSAAGSLPTSWDYSDASELAGTKEIHGGGRFAEAAELRGSLIIYKEKSTHTMTLGGAGVMAFDTLFSNRGAAGIECVGVLDDSHVVFGADDIYRHDGVRAESLLTDKQRRHIFDNIRRNSDSHTPRVVVNPEADEAWFIYSTGGVIVRGNILKYNYVTGVCSEMNTSHFAGVTELIYRSGASGGHPRSQIIGSFLSDPGLTRLDKTFTLNGSIRQCYAQREGITLGDPTMMKHVTKLYPRVSTFNSAGTSDPAQSIQCRVGVSNFPDEATNWEAYQSFTPGSQSELDFDVKGRYLAVEFYTSADMGWDLSGFSMEVDEAGDY